MQRKVNKIRSWRGLLVIATAALVPMNSAVADADHYLNSLWESSRFYTTPAALTPQELATARVSTHGGTQQNRVSVGRTDTLWSIARTNRPARNITIKQAMLAIRDANPRAFPSGNINDMEAGVTLVIPSAAAMRSRTAQQAEEEVRRQNQEWVASRPALQQPRQEQPDTTAPIETARDLQLTARDQQELDEQQALIEELEVRLEQSEDALGVAEREKDELATRISEMQEQLDTLQQLLRLKDEQLDELEAQLSEVATAPPEPLLFTSQPTITPQQLLNELQRQPLILGALGGFVLLLLLLLLALISTRRKLAAQIREQAELEEARRREEELHTLTDSNARPDDFDRDLNAQPLSGLDEMDDLDDFDDLELDDDLSDELAELDELTSVDSKEPPAAQQQETSKPQRDALQEAEMFIAYGRLEQAAGFLQKALAASPEREDLRVKLLEVLVELNDEETFQQQRQQLEAQKPSAASLERAQELAGLIQKAAAATGAATAGAAAAVAAKEEAQAEDLGELELPDDDLDDLELEDIFGSQAPDDEPAASQQEGPKNLDDLDLGDLDELEAELDEVLTDKPPLEPEPEDDLSDDLDDLEELADDEVEDLDLELDLEKPLDETELDADTSDIQDFEPVDYKSDADDFMSALDEISQEAVDESEAETEEQELQRAPGVDEELSELSNDLSELTGEEAAEADLDTSWDDLDDRADLDDLEISDDEPLEPRVSEEPLDDDLTGFDDLADLGDDLDFGNEEDLNTQLDLATAYIEMGDKQGAKEILEKVIAEGDADQQATAKQMLESLTA